MQYRLLFLLGLCFMILSGCAARHPDGSYVAEMPTNGFLVAVAEDAAVQVEEVYPPGHSTLFVQQANKQDFFYVVFERQLRAKGFAMPSMLTPGAVKISYTIDRLFESEKGEPIEFYLQLNMAAPDGTTQCFARPYSASSQRLGSVSATSWEGKSPRFPKVDKAGSSEGFITTVYPIEPRRASNPGYSSSSKSDVGFDDSEPWRY